MLEEEAEENNLNFLFPPQIQGWAFFWRDCCFVGVRWRESRVDVEKVVLNGGSKMMLMILCGGGGGFNL